MLAIHLKTGRLVALVPVEESCVDYMYPDYIGTSETAYKFGKTC